MLEPIIEQTFVLPVMMPGDEPVGDWIIVKLLLVLVKQLLLAFTLTCPVIKIFGKVMVIELLLVDIILLVEPEIIEPIGAVQLYWVVFATGAMEYVFDELEHTLVACPYIEPGVPVWAEINFSLGNVLPQDALAVT